jgi:hypothetical protein
MKNPAMAEQDKKRSQDNNDCNVITSILPSTHVLCPVRIYMHMDLGTDNKNQETSIGHAKHVLGELVWQSTCQPQMTE